MLKFVLKIIGIGLRQDMPFSEQKKIKISNCIATVVFFINIIGIHTGPLVAGVVGKKKFAYDVWGDTVNMASRMESSGEAGKINISGETHELVKDHFQCEYRGKVHAKNKGEVEMYFVSKPTC